ncbi:hypothetical protein LINPERHAP1_LOCUS1083 [Linum perenne]
MISNLVDDREAYVSNSRSLQSITKDLLKLCKKNPQRTRLCR